MKLLPFFLSISLALTACAQPEQLKVIAHRGVHTEAPENSRASLKASQKLGVWGSEFDIWLTRDDVCVINHNASYPGDSLTIKNSRLAELSHIRLANGEPVPTLDDYLELAAAEPSVTLVCELKRHGSDSLNHRLFDKAWERVCNAGMQGRIVFQTFSYDLCRYAAAKDPGVTVYYLCSKEKSIKSADDLIADGIKGGNYSAALWKAHPEWIEEFHSKGLLVIVTAQDDPETQREMIEAGADVMSSNRPAELMKLASELK